MAALLIEPGATLDYFTGIKWRRSERITLAIIPARGEVVVVTPAFEEPSVRETLQVGGDVRPWNEHESPFERILQGLRDRGVASGVVAVESTVRFFIVDGLRQASTAYRYRLGRSPGARVPSDQVAGGIGAHAIGERCDHRSAALGACARRARHECRGYRRSHGPRQRRARRLARVFAGAVERSFRLSAWIDAGPNRARGLDCPDGLRLLGARLSVRHIANLGVRPGERPPAQGVEHRQARPGNRARDGEDRRARRERSTMPCAATTSARVGAPATNCRDSRTAPGHGIGMDGHEPAYLVHGDATPLEAGMCFSDEPGIYIPGEFGVRLEDCWTMAASGPKLFTPLAKSLDEPI